MEMFKTLTSTLLAGDNTIEFTDSNITDTSILDCYFTDSDLIIEESSQTGTTVSITVSNHTEPVGVALFINNCDTFTPYDDTDVQNGLLQLETRVSLLESSMNNKQDKLTAGDNITIENNVISASGGGVSPYWSDLGVISIPALNTDYAIPNLSSYNEIYIECDAESAYGGCVVPKGASHWQLGCYEGGSWLCDIIGTVNWVNGTIKVRDRYALGFAQMRTAHILAR